MEKVCLKFGKDIVLSLDVASTEFYKDGAYHMDGKALSGEELSDIYASWVDEYPLLSIEDGFAEDDWRSWSHCMRDIGDRVQLVGDDLFVTNTEFVKKGVNKNAANAVLIKLNQIGTVSETIATIQLCQKAGWNYIISHRSGETEDTFMADFSVAMAGGQIKTGSASRSERIAKYNRLLEIEAELGKCAIFGS